MRGLIYLLELPVLDLVQVGIAHAIGVFQHAEYLLQLLRVLLVENLAVLDHVDEEHLLRVGFVVVVGDVVVVVVEVQLPELLLSALVQPAPDEVFVCRVQDLPQSLQDLAVLFLFLLLAEDVVGEEVVVPRGGLALEELLVLQFRWSIALLFGLEAQFGLGVDLRSGLFHDFPPVLIVLVRVLLVVNPHLINFPEDYFFYEVVLDALLHVHLQRPVVLVDEVAVVQVVLLQGLLRGQQQLLGGEVDLRDVHDLLPVLGQQHVI